MVRIKHVARKTTLCLITVYRYCISPILPPSCRFYPTCSEFSHQAFSQFGFLKGFLLTIKRLLKCHPFHQGGYDPVPEKIDL